jgi:hypothetical protein
MCGCSAEAPQAWERLAEAPYDNISDGVSKIADGSLYTVSGSSDVTAEDAARFSELGQAWLAAPASREASKALVDFCAPSGDSGGLYYAHIPLRKLSRKAEQAATSLYRALEARTDLKTQLPPETSTQAGPYLLMLGGDPERKFDLMQTCVGRFASQKGATALVAQSLLPLAKSKDADIRTSYETAREKAAGRTIRALPYKPLALVWYGQSQGPYAAMIGLPDGPLMADIDPVKLCGLDPDTSPDLGASNCLRLTAAASRKRNHGSDAPTIDVTTAWLEGTLPQLEPNGARPSPALSNVDRSVKLLGYRLKELGR